MSPVLVSVIGALGLWAGVAAQEVPLLHIKVSLLDADKRLIPVARHTLLVSDDPVTAPPLRVITSADGTAQIRLRPGHYILESDRPVILDGRTYEWLKKVDVVAGRDTTIELTMTDATAGAATSDVLRQAAAIANTPAEQRASILATWQASAFGLWTSHAHAAGFLVDDRGLVATSLRAIGDATSVEVQVSQSVKVTGAVIVADASHDVAVVRVHPSAIEGIRPVPIACDATGAASTLADANRYVINVPRFGPKDADTWLVDSAGGPVFAGDGRAIGLASPLAPRSARASSDLRFVDTESICKALASARAKLDATAAPDAARLPVETMRWPVATATDATVIGRAFGLSSYQLSTSDFDLTFLTPAVRAAAEARRDWTGGGSDGLNGRRLATDFENWADYVHDAPPLLYVRVTPRLVEGIWMKVARGAASTQGAAIPPIKRLRPGFSRMRLVCGGKDVVPVHPFRIQARVSETDAIEEGFYAFDPGAVGPACGAVSVVISSVKDPDKTETRIVDPAIVQRVWDDFANVRR